MLKDIEEVYLNTLPVYSTPKATNQDLWFWENIQIQNQDFAKSSGKNIDIGSKNNYQSSASAKEVKRSDEMTQKNFDIQNTLPKEFTGAPQNSEVTSDKSDNQMSYTTVEERQREVVVNKTIIRAIRRLYLNMFKSQNHKLVK